MKTAGGLPFEDGKRKRFFRRRAAVDRATQPHADVLGAPRRFEKSEQKRVADLTAEELLACRLGDDEVKQKAQSKLEDWGF